MMELNFTVVHDGEKWIAKHNDIIATGKTLIELDEDIRKKLKAKYKGEDKRVIRVNMSYDYSTFPHWFYQYQPYYFYRVIYVEI